MHVTRRIEEVDAAEARTQRFRQTFGEALDRQPRGVRGDDRSGRNEGCDLAIQIVLPLGFFGNGFDDQVAIPEPIEVLRIIGGVDVVDPVLRCQRRRLKLLQRVDGSPDDPVGIAFPGRQIEKHYRHFGICEVRCDLRAHHARSEYGGLAYDEVAQAVLLVWSFWSLMFAGNTPQRLCTKPIKRTFELYADWRQRQPKCGKLSVPIRRWQAKKKPRNPGLFWRTVKCDQKAIEYCAPTIQTLES
jgi:hypothetical protein